ncbi:MAG: aminopeptidase [Lachnospiraceae bacterium]
MDYRQLFQEENQGIRERYELALERICSIKAEETVEEPFRFFFRKTAGFIEMMAAVTEKLQTGELETAGLEELQEINRQMYQDILPESYETSYANPAYAVSMLGADFGRLLSFLYGEIRGQIVFAYESRLMEITILNEVFIEVYNLFEGELPTVQSVKDVLYWFTSDYCDRTVDYRVREGLDPRLSFAVDIIMQEDLKDLRYLYRFGEYISPSETAVASFLNTLPQETIDLMADTYTEGYRKGFQVMGRSLEGKKTVMIRYELGFERMIRKAILNFRAMGLEPVLSRAAVWSVSRNPNRKVGYYGASPNKQYDYDHRYDSALYMTKAFKERKLAVLRTAYEAYKDLAAVYAGPAVVETFGEEGFCPVNKEEAWKLSEKQEKLTRDYNNEAARILNEYIPGDETSFTIIAFPVPAIGSDFEEIFRETIAINTLEYETYQKIQQALIDRLDQAEYVMITGKEENQTRLKVMLHPLTDPASQTKFENCVADVNIPLGEVFTSPVLKGTEGTLQVSSVYIGDIQFKNLTMEFADGRVTEYSCDNFPDREQGRNLVKQVILKNHPSLPMGEFAIGTNTTAYAMAERFDIIQKLPILIVEKMGPHFAVGDTCYSWSEDCAVYNPDKKEIIARDNEISLLRKEDVSQAYFNCHTDITIPYRELDEIYGVTADGQKLPVIADGRFVVPGTESLNRPLEKK